jgi:hypothetical protein
MIQASQGLGLPFHLKDRQVFDSTKYWLILLSKYHCINSRGNLPCTMLIRKIENKDGHYRGSTFIWVNLFLGANKFTLGRI